MTRVRMHRFGACEYDAPSQTAFPLLSTVFVTPARVKSRDERKKVLKLSCRKRRQMDEKDIVDFRRLVLISNTIRRIHGEMREEKASLKREKEQDRLEVMLPEDAGATVDKVAVEEERAREEEDSSSSSDSSTDSSSSASSNSSSDDEEEGAAPEEESEDDFLLSASDLKKRAGLSKRQSENQCSMPSILNPEDFFGIGEAEVPSSNDGSSSFPSEHLSSADPEGDAVTTPPKKVEAAKRKLDESFPQQQQQQQPRVAEKRARLEDDLYVGEEDLLNEVYMPSNHPQQQMMMCMEDDSQLTVPLPLRQQEAAASAASASGKLNDGSCTITPFWSANSNADFASYEDGQSWPLGGGGSSSCGGPVSSASTTVPWVTISPTSAPCAPPAIATSTTTSSSQDKDLWSQLLPAASTAASTSSTASSSAFTWTVTASSTSSPSSKPYAYNSVMDWGDFEDSPAGCDNLAKPQSHSGNTVSTHSPRGDVAAEPPFCWDDEPRQDIDLVPVSDGHQNLSFMNPEEEAVEEEAELKPERGADAIASSAVGQDCNAIVGDASPAGSPDSQTSESSGGSSAEPASYLAPKGGSEKHFSCGQSSMFGELQSVVFNGLITSLES